MRPKFCAWSKELEVTESFDFSYSFVKSRYHYAKGHLNHIDMIDRYELQILIEDV